MGTAYRFNSEDTRNSPTLILAQKLIEKGCEVTLHDPYVKADDLYLVKSGLQKCFTRNMDEAVASGEILIFCTSHHKYLEEFDRIVTLSRLLKGIFDGCNLFRKSDFLEKPVIFAGIGKGIKLPSGNFLDFVYKGFKAVELGFANEIQDFIDFANERYTKDDFNRIEFHEVQKIARTCITGCNIVNPGPVKEVVVYNGFSSRLVRCAQVGSALLG